MDRVCTRSAAFTRARSPLTLPAHSTALVIDAVISLSLTSRSVLPGAAWRDTHAGTRILPTLCAAVAHADASVPDGLGIYN